ncbi:hypothetical protein J1N35_014476 [Gossypium stocksii]|uniref:Transposase (putative) gypsy type domain-containing protein n=1 Tax=Gossypium stocksii TaxID=47602 RepID=A0A9D3VU59_9ROSI|nr:hypothetical protein J1N35_014476 [Gossypium stocksii]
MVKHLATRGISLPNFAYDFEIVKGECSLNDSSDGFILPLYLLEASFYLPLHPFFYVVLNDYGIAPGQLTGLSWWTLVAYFINCSKRYEPPFIGVFQYIYQLNFII